MSHAIGMVRFDNGLIMYYEYDGTSGFVIPKLYETHDEMSDNWRKWEWDEPSCEHDSEPVEIFTAYGKGFFWSGSACHKCNMIIDGRDPFEMGESDGIPEWVHNESLRLYGKRFSKD